MEVEMLDTIEDSNKFHGADLDHPAHAGTVAQSVLEADDDDKPIIVHRLDKLKNGQVYDLPDSQARRLIDMGYARAVSA